MFKKAIQTLASHYGPARTDVFQRHRAMVNPVFTEDVILREFSAFKRMILVLKLVCIMNFATKRRNM